jgi:two-component system, OmpR family, alkaline phosphatase synthesis response regulator PhoP
MNRNRHVLIVEDEAAIAMPLRDRLESEGYAVAVAPDGDSGLAEAREGRYDAIVLDLMLPGMDGIRLCRELRTGGDLTPVLMLTALDATPDKVAGLRTGADDYLTKPFEMVELVARLEALIRRDRSVRQPRVERYQIGAFTLDLRRQELRRDDEVIPLSTQEYKLLKYLYEHRGEIVDRDELLSAVWGYDESTYSRTVDVHVAWLRRKLGDRGRRSTILTVRGRGYKFVEE